MADHGTTDPTDPAVPIEHAEADGGSPRRPSPAAAAASRARRIGGRTSPRPAAGDGTAPDTAAVDGGSASGEGAPTAPTAASAAPTAADTATAGESAAASDSEAPTAPASAETASDETASDETASEKTASDETASDETASEKTASPGEHIPVPGWLRWGPAAVVVAGAVAMAVLVAVVSHGVWWGKPGAPSATQQNTVRDQVLAAAKTCLAATNTYKYTALPAFESAGVACSTGTYTGQFTSAYTNLIKKYAPTLKASQTAQINKAGIQSVADGQWTLLMFGQLAVTNSNFPKGRTDPFAAQVRMQKVGGKWLISSLKTVGSPVSS